MHAALVVIGYSLAYLALGAIVVAVAFRLFPPTDFEEKPVAMVLMLGWPGVVVGGSLLAVGAVLYRAARSIVGGSRYREGR